MTVNIYANGHLNDVLYAGPVLSLTRAGAQLSGIKNGTKGLRSKFLKTAWSHKRDCVVDIEESSRTMFFITLLEDISSKTTQETVNTPGPYSD